MTKQFHKNLNRMSVFIVGIVVILVIFYKEFINLAIQNMYLNGVIIGVGLFGIIFSFINIFELLPEYRWIKNYFYNNNYSVKEPHLLRPVYSLINNNKVNTLKITEVNSMLDMVFNRFDSDRELLRYVINTLVFLGLLGTFWGLVTTLGGFADLIINLDFEAEDILNNLQQGIYKPVYGMSIAFTSSLLGLASSLIVSFLNLQVNEAQNCILEELENNLVQLSQISSQSDSDNEEIVTKINNLEKITKELKKRFLK